MRVLELPRSANFNVVAILSVVAILRMVAVRRRCTLGRAAQSPTGWCLLNRPTRRWPPPWSSPAFFKLTHYRVPPSGHKNYRRSAVGPLTSLTIVLRLTNRERALLEREATARGRGATARMLIERALQDDLVKAILDE
jgi:hypothetical protein